MLARRRPRSRATDYETVLLDGLRPDASTSSSRHRRLPRLQEQRARRSSSAPASTFDAVRPDRLRHPRLVRGALHEPARSSTSTRRPPRTSCGRRCAGWPTRSPIRRPRRAIAVELINGNGNPNFLSPEGETFRWETESQLIVDTTPDGTGVGVPDADELADEVDAYAEVGLFGDGDAADDRRLDRRVDPRGDLRRQRNGHLARPVTAARATRPSINRRVNRSRACSTSCLSWATSASMPSNLRSLRRKWVKRTSARSP